MGMLSHGVTLTVIMKNGTILESEFGFDNEEWAILSNRKNLFRDMKQIGDFRDHFMSAFNTQYPDLDFASLMEDLGDIDYLEDAMDELQEYQVDDISKIVLMTDIECDGYREYSWEKYELMPYRMTKGSGRAQWSRERSRYLPSSSDFIRNTVLQPGDIPTAKEKTAVPRSQKNVPVAALTFDKFGADFDYTLREQDMVFFGTTYPRGVIIKGYKGTQKKVIIPETVEDYPVIHIADFGQQSNVEEVIFDNKKITFSDSAFKGCTKMANYDANGCLVMFGVLLECRNMQKKMILPSGAIKIGSEFSKENALIEEVIISEGTEIIDKSAFEKCPNLRVVHFPKSLKTISSSAFADCPLLENPVFSEGLQEICWNAFQKCTSITAISFPQSLVEIGDRAFSRCRNLNSIEIHPDTRCGEAAFSGCGEKLMGSDGLTVVNGVLYDFDYRRHWSHLGITGDEMRVELPGTVKQINGDICFNSPGFVLDSFTITDQVCHINTGDFFLSGVESFRIVDHVTGEMIVETDAFANCPNLLTSSERYETFCELVAEKDYNAIRNRFSGKKSKIQKTASSPTVQLVENSVKQSDEEYLAEQSRKNYAEWMGKYAASVEKNSGIVFAGKTFVLSGVSEEILVDGNVVPVEKNILDQGGVIRQKVSGKTDYLIVDPRWAGESKTKNALEQQNKGKSVKIVLLEDFLTTFTAPKVTTENTSVPESETPAPKKAEKKNPKTKSVGQTASSQPPKVRTLKLRGRQVPKSDCEIDFLDALTGYNGTEDEIILPSGITSIGHDAFSLNKTLRSIVIPEEVTEIESDAFWGCESLEYVRLPESLKEIGSNAFHRCESLKEIVIPENVRSIGMDAFSCCDSLRDIYISDSVWDIGYDAFSYIHDEAVIHTTKGSDAETYAKENNIKVGRRKLPKNEDVFDEKDLAFEFYELISWLDGCVDSDGCISDYDGVNRKIALSSGIVRIGSYAFQGKLLASVKIPSSVETIGSSAFSDCVTLMEVSLEDGIQKIDSFAFRNCRNLKSITLPETLQHLDSFAFDDCAKLEEVTILGQLPELASYTFAGCEKLTEIQLPETIKKLGSGVFSRCSALKKIHLPGSLTHIEKGAFACCRKLEKILIPVQTETIGEEVFQHCQKLKHIHVSQFVEHIGENAFEDIAEDAIIHVVAGSYAEQYCKDHNLKYDHKLDKELAQAIENILIEREAEAERKRQEEAERLRREAAERERRAKEEAQRREREEQRRREVEEEKRRQEEQLAVRRARYDQLMAMIAEQSRIIRENTGWFGEQAKIRRAAKEQKHRLEALLAEEFPNGRP